MCPIIPNGEVRSIQDITKEIIDSIKLHSSIIENLSPGEKGKLFTSVKSEMDKLINLEFNKFVKPKENTIQGIEREEKIKRKIRRRKNKSTRLIIYGIHRNNQEWENRKLDPFTEAKQFMEKKLLLNDVKIKKANLLGRNRDNIPLLVSIAEKDRHRIFKNSRMLKSFYEFGEKYSILPYMSKEQLIKKKALQSVYNQLKASGQRPYFNQENLMVNGKIYIENEDNAQKVKLGHQRDAIQNENVNLCNLNKNQTIEARTKKNDNELTQEKPIEKKEEETGISRFIPTPPKPTFQQNNADNDITKQQENSKDTPQGFCNNDILNSIGRRKKGPAPLPPNHEGMTEKRPERPPPPTSIVRSNTFTIPTKNKRIEEDSISTCSTSASTFTRKSTNRGSLKYFTKLFKS